VSRLALRLRRLAGLLFYPLAVASFGVLIAVGLFRSVPAEGTLAVVAALTLAVLLLLRLLRAATVRVALPPGAARHQPEGTARTPPGSLRTDLELGGMLLVAAYAAFQATGGARSLLHPLVYAIVAFAVTLQRRAVGLPLVVWAALLEVALYHSAPAHARPRLPSDEALLGAHLGFLGLFAALHLVLLSAEVWRQRREHRLSVDGELRRMRDEARDFRLIGAQLPQGSRHRNREEEQEIIAAASVENIHQALFYTIELLKKSLDLHTAVLLWLDDSETELRIKELASDSDALQPGPIAVHDGVLGAIAKDRVPVRLRDPKPEHLPYYASPQPIGAFLGVPILESSEGGGLQQGDSQGPRHLRGLLCVDRLVTRVEDGAATATPFDQRDEQLLQGAAREILRAVRAERIFVAVERGKYETEAFFRASERLNSALTPEQVFDTAFAAARELCDFDFAAITRFDAAAHSHAVVAAIGEDADQVSGLRFVDNAGLVAMAIKTRHMLPASPNGDLRRERESPIFTRKARLRGFESLLVLPLVAADAPLGAMVLAARAPRRFGKDKRDLLGVIANQVAVSAKNADLYRAMEELATTDGLTGLANHRTFQERLGDLLLRAERQHQPVSLLLTDIDHFKKVNDTHGHPIGDVVLRGVAAICRAQVRKIDLAARYGGEEFAIVLDGTDRDGALQLAERIRNEVAGQKWTSDKGSFSCTLSLGIASYPEDGRDGKTLITHADQALYHAKHGGRNRAVAWARIDGQPPLRAVK